MPDVFEELGFQEGGQDPFAGLGFVERKRPPIQPAAAPVTAPRADPASGPSWWDRAKEAAFTPAIKAAGGATLTDVYDLAADSAADLVSRVTGTPKGQLRRDFPAVAFASELARTAPEAIDFLTSPGGAVAAVASKFPATAPAVGAAFTMDMASQVPEAWEAVRKDPSAENVARLVKTGVFTLLPGIHARSQWKRAGEAGKSQLNVAETPEPTGRAARDALARLRQSAGRPDPFQELGFQEQPARAPSRAERRASAMPPETGAPEAPEIIVDPRLKQIAEELNLGEYEKLTEQEKATVRQLRDEAERKGNDRQNIQGLPGEERGRQAAVQAQPVEGAGGETPSAGRVLQAPEGEVIQTESFLDRAESETKARIEQRWKDAGTTLSSGPGLAIEQLADYALLGAVKIAKGAVKFGQWSAEMIAEHGEAIRPYLGKIWVRAQRIHKEQLASGTEGAGGRPVATAAGAAAPEAGRLITSPSYDQTKGNFLKRFGAETQTRLQARLNDFEERNPERQVVTHADIARRAFGLDPKIVADLDLKRLREGQTLDPAVRYAAESSLQSLEQEIGARDEQLRNPDLTGEQRDRLLRQREGLERDARRLIDVLIPTRSQDGRNLAYHAMMAAQSFDVTYWLSRARRAMAIPERADLPAEVQSGIEKAARRGAAAEQRAIDRVMGAPAAEEATGRARKPPDRRTVDEKGNALPTAEERQARYKQRLLETARRELAGEPTPARAPSKWELTPEQRRQVEQDPEVRAARIELARKMQGLEKTGLLDAITAYRRAGLLTGVRTHLRNIGGNTAFQVLEEVQRAPSVVVDAALRIFTGRRTVQGPSAKAMARASYEAATRGIREARQIMREGSTEEQLAQLDLVKEINTGNRAFDAAVNTVFRSMAAEDRVFKVYAFERSLQEQMALAKVKAPTDAMLVKAWEDANYATFNNKNVASEAWGTAKGWAKQHGPAGQATAFAMDLTVPFARTPANIVARVIDYTPVGGIARAGAAAARAWRAKGWTPENQRDFSLAIGRGLTGSALMSLGYWLAKNKLMTGVSEEERGKRAVAEAAGRMYGSILVGDTWHRVDSVSPVGNLLVLGATLASQEAKRGDLGAVAFAGAKTVMEQPMLRGMSGAAEAIANPQRTARQYVGQTAGSFVPTMVADVAALTDTKRRESRGKDMDEAVGRAVAVRVPGLRQTLPERVDVLGERQEQRPSTVINPTIGSPAKELGDPVLKAMLENGVSMDFREQGKTESDDAYRRRIHAEGIRIRARLEWLMRTPAYQRADTEQRQHLMEAQISKVRAEAARR